MSSAKNKLSQNQLEKQNLNVLSSPQKKSSLKSQLDKNSNKKSSIKKQQSIIACQDGKVNSLKHIDICQMSERQWSAGYNNENFSIHEFKRKQNIPEIKSKTDLKLQVPRSPQHFAQIFWEAAFLDQKFFLSDPSSLAKLRELENQIQNEKRKLNNIETGSQMDVSFLSQRQLKVEGAQNQNKDQQCLTQINQSKLLHRQKNAQTDLLNEQEKYRKKLQEMRKKKSVLKRQIGCGTNDKNLQVKESDKKKLQSSKVNQQGQISDKPIISQVVQETKSQRVQKESQRNNQPHKPATSIKNKQIQMSKSIKDNQIDYNAQNPRLQSKVSQKKVISQIQVNLNDKGQSKMLLNLPSQPQNENGLKSQTQNKSISKKSEFVEKNVKKQSQNNSKVSEDQQKLQKLSKNQFDNQNKSSGPRSIANVQMKDLLQKNVLPSEHSSSVKKPSSKKSKNQESPQIKQKSDGNNTIVKSIKNQLISSGQKEQTPNPGPKQNFESSLKFSSNGNPLKDGLQKNSEHKQSLENQNLPPQIIIHTQSFKKTDKSVQWEQIQPSVSRIEPNLMDNSMDYKSKTKEIINSSKVKSSKSSQQIIDNQKEQSLNLQKSIKLANSKKEVSQNKNFSSNMDYDPQQPSNRSQFMDEVVQNKSLLTEKEKSKISNSQLEQSQQVSEKKKTSFKIHSRQSSVKSKKSHSRPSSYQKRNQAQQNSVADSISNKKSNLLSNQAQIKQSQSRLNQLQIRRLNQQIMELQNKLKRVQEKQDQMVKFQNLQSKVMGEQLEASHAGSSSEPASPLGKFTLTSRLKLQAKLSLQGSTVQFNTYEEKMKQTAEENQKLQKLRLQQEIGRLKKIIRDMQMDKIKSIEYEQNQSLSKVQLRRPSLLDHVQNNNSRVSEKWKDSLNSDMLETKRNEWNSSIGLRQQTGRIKKNSPIKYQIDSPRKYNKSNAEKAKQFSEIAVEDDKEHEPLPLRKKAQSVQGGSRSRDLTKSELINKFQQNGKNFHQFLQSSRLLAQEPESLLEPVNSSVPEAYEHKNEGQLSPGQKNIASIPSKPVTRNFSEIMEKLKHENPENEIAIPSQIVVGTISMPDLAESPNLSMSQEDLLELAKRTYSLFGVNIEEDQNQLCMKKYKNCVVFTFGNNQQQTILWHYSGKFYYGGWKNTNDPGEGEKVGEGLEYIPGKHLYKGQFLGGKKNGNGILKMANGNIYDGQWVDGIKNGRGVYYEASTGTYYSGEWKDGKRDGYGILRFSNNEFYQGTFAKSIKQGYGAEKFANGDYYKGEYQKGKFHGKGKYCWSNGSSYEGNFVEGCRHGQGNWKSARKAGDIYIGEYQHDKKCGYGRYVWSNGCVYQGYFKNDLKNGKGRLVYQDGKQIKGSWQDGNLVSADQESRKGNEHEEQPLRRSIRASSLKNTMNSNQNAYRRPFP